MRPIFAVALLAALSTCALAAAQGSGGDAPSTFVGAAPGVGSTTSPVSRATYDDRRQSVLILDGALAASSQSSGVVPAGAVVPLPNTPSSAIYQPGMYPPGQQPIYQPGQQFQLSDCPRQPIVGGPVAYSTVEAPSLAPGMIVPNCFDYSQEAWHWQLMPAGLIWHSYLAGPKEPRMGAVFVADTGVDTKFDGTVGGRVGLLRYGNSADFRPEGWELDLEGAAFIRQDLTENSDVDGYDFRVGIPVTYGWGPWQMKVSWYHTSSHLGDEFMIKHPTFPRINYSRNAVVWGLGFYPIEDLRLYGEVDYGYWTSGGNQPWAFQFGWEYSPVVRGWWGAPFAAMNVYMRQENDFGGPFTVEAGWQWRPDYGGQLIRLGFNYQDGPSMFDQFFRDSEQLIGFGLWYDY